VTNIDMHDVTTFGSSMVDGHSGYNPTSGLNPLYVKVHDNEVNGGSITVSVYSDAVRSTTVAGDVDISHNQVTAPSTYGILIFARVWRLDSVGQ
jgi:hypothetical protein